jgi:hypothetical protein
VEQVSDRSIRSQNTGRNSVENWECWAWWGTCSGEFTFGFLRLPIYILCR